MTQMTDLARRDAAHLIHPVTAPREMDELGARVVVEGDGWMITDDRGRRLIDGFAGLWCVNVGHGRPEIIDAVREQMETLEYFTTFHGQSHPKAIELAERLCAMFPPEYGLDRVMFSSGGSEANETNIKLVRLYWAVQGQDRRHVIVARMHGYHGLTVATMTATGIMPMRWNFGPEAEGFEHIPAPYCYKCDLDLEYPTCGLACANAFEELVERQGPETIAAFIAEPVIGAAGIIPPPDGYFARIREICDRHGILLVLDEVVTGFGRTGSMFGMETYGVRPDLVTFAKGLSSGYLPLGASVVAEHVWQTIATQLPDQMPISHGFTYSGHPTCCAAALANLDIIEREDLAGNAADVGGYLVERLREVLADNETVGDIRGVGLMIGIELVADRATKRGFSRPHHACTRVEHIAWENGLYCRAMGMETVGLAPPLDIDRACADEIVRILKDAIDEMEAEVLPGERARGPKPESERVHSAAELFTRMEERFDPALAAGVDLVMQFALDGDGGGLWLVTVRDGSLRVEVLDAPRDDASATFHATAADYVKIANGDLSGADAFTTQRLRVDGDLGAAAKLGELRLL
ncbi:MAG: aminotransferase class III-fold pyridoxal phosphate-dependent enzyme [Actinobacteria bacterium]|nr:aminotransferase class III-fold pyridoxal phosphate-dependent enzyme [Actinomycetota bacterium]